MPIQSRSELYLNTALWKTGIVQTEMLASFFTPLEYIAPLQMH